VAVGVTVGVAVVVGVAVGVGVTVGVGVGVGVTVGVGVGVAVEQTQFALAEQLGFLHTPFAPNKLLVVKQIKPA
jgi:hypothetical protein